MPKRSAGLLLWRRRADGELEVLLGHPGGPFFAHKDDGAWSVLKGEIEDGEDAYDVARREFQEETGAEAPGTEPIVLGEVRLSSGKVVAAWALEGDLDPDAAESNTFELEWPPRSGRVQTYPEIDRVAWFDLRSARVRLNHAQTAFVDRLVDALAVDD